MNDIEKLLISDAMYKKKIGRNIKHRASRRGYIKGGVKTQSDYLTRKQKLELNGEIKVSNVYKDINNIPSYKEFGTKDYALRKSILENARKYHKNTDISKKMEISMGTLYRLYTDYNIVHDKGRYKISKKELGNYLLPDKERMLLTRGVTDIIKKLTLSSVEKGKVYVNLRVNGVTTKEIANLMDCTTSTVSLYSNDYFRLYDKGTDASVDVRKIFTKVVKLYNIKLQVKLYKDDPIELDGYSKRLAISNNADDFALETRDCKMQDTDDKNKDNINEDIDTVAANELKSEIERLKEELNEKQKEIDSYRNKKGTYVSLVGEYSFDDLSDRIIAVTSTIQGGKTYKINLTIEEL